MVAAAPIPPIPRDCVGDYLAAPISRDCVGDCLVVRYDVSGTTRAKDGKTPWKTFSENVFGERSWEAYVGSDSGKRLGGEVSRNGSDFYVGGCLETVIFVTVGMQ